MLKYCSHEVPATYPPGILLPANVHDGYQRSGDRRQAVRLRTFPLAGMEGAR